MRISALRVNTIVRGFLPPFSTVRLVLSSAVTTPVNWRVVCFALTDVVVADPPDLRAASAGTAVADMATRATSAHSASALRPCFILITSLPLPGAGRGDEYAFS